MNREKSLRFTLEHEWVFEKDGEVLVGVSQHAQDALGDVVYLELPEVGDSFEKGEPFGVIESVKTTSDLFAPVSGEVVDVNESLVENCALVNEDPYGEAWMIRLRMSDPTELDGLMDFDAYQKFLADSHE